MVAISSLALKARSCTSRQRRNNAHTNGVAPDRNRGRDRAAGRVDHRNIVGGQIRDVGVFSVRRDGDQRGAIPHRDRGPHHRIGGRVDHRDIVGDNIRDVSAFPIRRDGDPSGASPHRDLGRLHRVGGRVDHRDSVGGRIRDIGVFPILCDGDPLGYSPPRPWPPPCCWPCRSPKHCWSLHS